MLVVHVVILGNLGQFNHCTNSKWQIDNQNVIFGFIQTRGTIHEYSLSFEEAFKDLADDAHEVRPLLAPTAVCKLLTATVVCGRHAMGTLRDGAYLVFKVTPHKVSIVLT